MTVSEEWALMGPHFDNIARLSVTEDLGSRGDPTGASLGDRLATADLVAREPGVLAGLPAISATLEAVRDKLDSGPVQVTLRAEDGDGLEPGQVVANFWGPAVTLLAAERPILNLICHLSGIASLTAKFVGEVKGTNAVVRDTRKTTPGLRHLEKYAVRCGGGENHRMGLYDALLVKDNHVAAAGSVLEAVKSARSFAPDLPLEVEVDTLAELQEALDAGCELVLLDNMDLPTLGQAIEIIGAQAKSEASGGVTLESIGAIARTGVDYIAAGALTHSAPILDMGIDWRLDTR